ncbi:MAG: hypothetical protein IV100_25395 [Myxococcales bacterium]|nr:hypothetical protein [Myxococcales bacterium]
MHVLMVEVVDQLHRFLRMLLMTTGGDELVALLAKVDVQPDWYDPPSVLHYVRRGAVDIEITRRVVFDLVKADALVPDVVRHAELADAIMRVLTLLLTDLRQLTTQLTGYDQGLATKWDCVMGLSRGNVDVAALRLRARAD